MDTKRIFVLGNGFDLAHYLPTAYVHFMNAMRVIESCKEDQELGFDDLFQNYLSDESSDRDKGFFSKTKELYKTDDLRLSIDTVKELQIKLKNNGWFKYFKHHLTDVDTWIDFENEIEKVLMQYSDLFSNKFNLNTVFTLNDFLKGNGGGLEGFSGERGIKYRILEEEEAQISDSFFKELGMDNLFYSKILYSFGIIYDIYGVYESSYSNEEYKRLGSDEYHRTEERNIKVMFDSQIISKSVFKNVIRKIYLSRMSNVYTSFNENEILRKVLSDLISFAKIFTIYIEKLINSLKPAKYFCGFGDLAKEIDAVYTFNYSNTFERLYPKSLANQLNRTEVQYIHGSAERKNIVLGISDLDEGKLKKYKIYGFVKTFQKLVSNTDYMFLDNSDVKLTSKPPINYLLQNDYEIIIWGHSLDSSDGEYIREMFNLNSENLLNGVTIKIWYHSSPHIQLANLMHIMGKDIIQEWMKKGWLVFEAAPDIYAENKKAE